MTNDKNKPNSDKLDKIVAEAHRNRDKRDQGYREKALKMYPWICGRCSREFTQANVRELTVHHRNHNHDDNPEDGSNWELLCVYCHDNEHSRLIDDEYGEVSSGGQALKEATNNPFAGLAGLIKEKK
ncbi:MAG: HNH nuclease family protein [Gammaproteobacteria bacterium]|nr:HNH nuclease family protein [Gammaproteobacteria bacterium]